jgi:hypothetical protein
MILFHEELPCSENFFRYFRNYDKYMEEKLKQKQEDHPMTDQEESNSYMPKM